MPKIFRSIKNKTTRSSLFGFLIVFSSILTAKEACESSISDIEDTFYSILNRDHGDPINDALEFISGSKACFQSPTEKATYGDLNGVAFHAAYALGHEEFFDFSYKAFNQAAALNTTRNEKIYWHVALLMRNAGKYSDGIEYLNKVFALHPKSETVFPYLVTAFQLSVDTNQWADAKGLMEELSRRNQRFYADPDVLLSSVITLCHFEQLNDAKKIIQNVEDHVILDDTGKHLLQKSKDALNNCRPSDLSQRLGP